jgi:cytochrome c-type biogenesis protein CcmH
MNTRNFWRCISQVLVALFFLNAPAHAVQPDEILKDPALENRAREISTGLRCLVCQNQSIDDSDAPVARDLRVLIREQLQQNKTDEQVIEFVVARYGDFVLLKPRLSKNTWLLWFSPFLMLLLSLIFIWRRKTKPAILETPLNAAEESALQKIIRK